MLKDDTSLSVLSVLSVGVIKSILLAFAILCAGIQSAEAQIITEKWAITDPGFSELSWGPHEIVVTVRNNSGGYKFFAVKSAARSPMRRYSEIRAFQSNYIFLPDEEKEVTIKVDVPENFTYITLDLGFYDVVDTLDDVSLGKEIYQHIYTITPPTPAGLTEYTSFAPRAGSVLKFNASLNSDFSLLVHKILQDPLSIGALSKRVGLPLAVVSRTIKAQEEYGFVKERENGSYRSTLTAIEGLPAELVNALIKTNTARMVEALEEAIPEFITKRQQMMDAGLITKGKRETLEGTGMMHHLYALVGGIVLWEEVGSQYLIGGPGPPQVIELDAPCDMVTEGYGYVLIDRKLRDGDEFFFYDPNLKRRVFGDRVPSVLCTRRTPNVTVKPSYYLPVKKPALMYIHEKDRVEDAVKILRDPLVSIREKFSADVATLFKNQGVRVTPAHRYWFWNMLVSSIMGELTRNSTIENHSHEFFTWRDRETE